MAQLDPAQKFGNNSTTASTVEQLLRGADSRTWSPSAQSSSRTTARSQDLHHDPEDIHYQPKKLTVLAKVKEKARRWRYSFSKRKKEEDNTTPSWGVRLEDEDGEDDDPEYLGAPMYESKLAPERYKEHARQHQRAITVISEKHVLPSTDKSVAEVEANKKEASVNSTKTAASQMTAFEDDETWAVPPIKVTDKQAQKTDTALSPRENKWDKGVSVREYIKNKFEPGEDEKALSQVISDVISPKRGSGDVGVIEKVKGAVNSLLWREEPTQSTIDNSAANSSSTTPSIPNFNNAEADTKEDKTGRILQANQS